jgi:hypothetical protein
MLNINILKQLSFSGPHIDAKSIENVQNYLISDYAIVINIGMDDAIIGYAPQKCLPPLTSTILKDANIISADLLIVIITKNKLNIGNIILEPEWNLYGNQIPENLDRSLGSLTFPKNTPLWKSSQDTIGTVKFDPYFITGQKKQQNTKSVFNVKVNIWFATSETSCFIHNEHDFIEVHTQIYGNGRMQKFKAQNAETLFEEILMFPGYTTPIPFCNVKSDYKFVYPWHQYYADTDCIWLAIEYHACI